MKVFISYNRESQEAATKLARDIEELGHTAWMDHKLAGAQAWWNEILTTIRACDVFVFILDPASLESEACKREWGYAHALGKAILPVLSSDGVGMHLLPRALVEIQYVDYRNRDASAALRLARAFVSLPDPKPLPEPLPEPPEVPVSYLGGLAEMVGQAELSYSDQSALVFDLRRSLNDPDARDDAIRLLRQLRGRRDVFAVIAEEIDAVLRPKTPPPPPLTRGHERTFEHEEVAGDRMDTWAPKTTPPPTPADRNKVKRTDMPRQASGSSSTSSTVTFGRLLGAMGIGLLAGVVLGWLAAAGLLSILHYSVFRDMGGDEVPGFIALLTVVGICTHLALGLALNKHMDSLSKWIWPTIAGWGAAAICTWLLAYTMMFGDLTGIILLPILGGAFAGIGQVHVLKGIAPRANLWWITSSATWLAAVILANMFRLADVDFLTALLIIGAIGWLFVLPFVLWMLLWRS